MLRALGPLDRSGGVRDGEQRNAQSYRGTLRRRGYFPSQELTNACRQFRVINFGASAPFWEYLTMAGGDVDSVERNQRFRIHLDAEIHRGETGVNKSAPCRGRDFPVRSRNSPGDLRRSILAHGSLSGDQPIGSMVVKSNDRDPMRPSRGRDFPTL